MVWEVHTLDASDTGSLLNIVWKEMGLFGTDKVKVIQRSFYDIHTPEWIENQPLERMPYMVDTETGLVLYESRTIAKYVADKIGSPLVPDRKSGDVYWHFDKAFNSEAVHMCPWLGIICLELIYAPGFYKREPDMKSVEMADQEVQKTLKGYERILGNQKWLAGNELTLVDLWHVILIKMCQMGGALKYLTDGTYPNVQKWWEALDSRQSVKEAFKMKMEAAKALMG